MSTRKKGKLPEEEASPQETLGGEAAENTAAPEMEEPEKQAPAKQEEAAAAPDDAAAEKDRYLRLLAEYDNFRKRSAKEREAIYGDVKSDTVAKFLPVYDNLVRALAQDTVDGAYKKGVEMIMAQFMEVLGKLGVTEIAAMGQQFDPSLHNAVMHVDDETLGENEIVEEFQKGFRLGEKVIRFSVVKVAN